jgi:hypothetical protein
MATHPSANYSLSAKFRGSC